MRRSIVCLLAAAVAASAADRDLLKLVMPDARVLTGIQVDQIKKTPFGRFLLAEFSASEDKAFDGFVKASGFDPRYNLSEILIASPAGTERERRLVAARGTFDAARILEVARNAGAKIENYRGIDILSSTPAVSAAPGGVPMAVAFLSGTLAVAGDLESVRGAVERRDSGTGPAADMLERAKTVSAGSDAWFVSKVPVSELAQGLPGTNLSNAMQGDVLKSIEQASGAAVFGDMVKLSAQLVTHTEEDAATLAGVLRFLSGMMRIGPQETLASAMTLKPEGRTLKLDASVPEALLETLIRQAGK